MIERPDVTLNGVSLGLVDSRIYINKVKEGKPNINVNAVSFGNHVGQHVTFTERNYHDVTVQVAILERDIAEHAKVLQYINKWCADGGKLETNYRTGQHCDVMCIGFPQVANITDWTRNRYTITFRAFGVPYWVSNTPNVLTAVSGDNTLFVGGSADTPLEMVVTASGAVNGVKVTGENGAFMEFTGLGLVNGDVLKVYHENGIVYAKKGGVNLLDKRTIGSYDDVILHAGNNVLNVSVDGSASVELRAYGRWS